MRVSLVLSKSTGEILVISQAKVKSSQNSSLCQSLDVDNLSREYNYLLRLCKTGLIPFNPDAISIPENEQIPPENAATIAIMGVMLTWKRKFFHQKRQLYTTVWRRLQPSRSKIPQVATHISPWTVLTPCTGWSNISVQFLLGCSTIHPVTSLTHDQPPKVSAGSSSLVTTSPAGSLELIVSGYHPHSWLIISTSVSGYSPLSWLIISC